MKRIASLLIALAVCAAISAQHRYSPNLTLGAKGGLALSEMSFSPSVRQTFRPGFTLGFVARYTEEKHFGVIAELLLSQKGWNENFDGAPYRYGRTLTYVELPILTHIFFGSKRMKGFFNLGPQIGYMISDKKSTNLTPDQDLTELVSSRPTEHMWMDVSHKFDYGITAGLGGEFRLTPKQSVMLEGRFYFGLGNIFPDGKSDAYSASRSLSIQVAASYLFRVI